MPIIVEQSEDSKTIKKFNTRQFVTENGKFDSFEEGRYFMCYSHDRKVSDVRGILRKIAAINGVEKVWTKGYQTTVEIGKAFDWEKDGIESSVLEILGAL